MAQSALMDNRQLARGAKRTAILMMLLSVMSSSAAAGWAQQPLSFVGIALGKPLSESVPKMCEIQSSMAAQIRYRPPIGELCIEDRSGKNFKPYKDSFKAVGVRVPPLGSVVDVTTSDDTLDGKVGHLQIGFESSMFSQVMEMLTIKYGSPHKKEILKFKTKGGAEFDDIVLMWSGGDVSIKVNSLADRKYIGGSLWEFGRINVFTSEYLTQKSKESNEAAKKAAAGL